ncbi:uncharacterized protein BT62DRAFT_925232 [Guyanagaster necrorhizus]|uniref:Uncharacterized protein n=1 Tax=Guyanagaster necrorhizus TaxID=856835 RepID=A0A9P7W5T3_9AGAR|nr:uncharacterized protein BT62DRAFT_925232 [Guyanagaster necrorhizus MCA 3950]KAG7452682.1 hypothetical protein BT62DRAFT_925232 [Guyanagaster necrorhizus MCA 3950]
MHRFRKKSDANRVYIPPLHTESALNLPGHLPELPPASDFRTSLILPDLSRRFSVLRSSSGAPLSADALRSKLAEQRARGLENQVTEEEEDMILESLGLGRSRPSTPARSREEASDGGARQSSHSSTTMGSSYSPSSSSRASSMKRYSNNLFGSGKLRDYTYMRTAHNKSHSRAQTSMSSAETSHQSIITSESMQSSTPPDMGSNHLQIRSTPLLVPTTYNEQIPESSDMALPWSLGASAYKRASMALQQAISEMEEEEPEDEIVLPRSAPIVRLGIEHRRSPEVTRTSDPPSFEAGMAISSDKQMRTDEERASPIPSRTLPGYIPGMPRPMTPHENADADEQRSYSTTPRAASPPSLPARVDSPSPIFPPSLVSGLFRQSSTSSPSSSRGQSPRPVSPLNSPSLFLQRSVNGRQTPDEPSRLAEVSVDSDKSLNSSILGRRRAASPLSTATYQPMTTASRPGTPSNGAWSPPVSPGPKSSFGHSRSGSWFSDANSSAEVSGSFDQSNRGGTRSLKSPALPDSPLIDRGHGTLDSISSSYSSFSDKRPGSPMSIMELTPSTSKVVRSPTPTQSLRSPASPTFPGGGGMSPRNGSKRSSRQNGMSNPFNFGPTMFSPIASSSRSSLESAGSSYHSWEGDYKENSMSLFNDTDPQQPAWHDVYVSDQSSSITPGGSPNDEWDAEEIIRRYAGLKKADFLAIQEKLVGVAVAKLTPSSSSESYNRAPSLRRRRPSTAQSNYSVNGRIGSPAQSQPSASPPNEGLAKMSNATVDVRKVPSPEPVNTTVTGGDISPTTRKNRDLAHVLFGYDEAEGYDSSPTPKPMVPVTHKEPMDNVPVLTSPLPLNINSPPAPTPENTQFLSPPTSPYVFTQNPSPRLPQSPEAEAELAREVQRRTEAAMLALKKPGPPKASEGLSSSGSVSRKRVSPHQISTPTLVSASTSVDTIPLRAASISASQSGPSRIGSRFKKLRGTLRKNNIPTGEEVTPYPLVVGVPPPTHAIGYGPDRLNPAIDGMGAMSATEPRFKVPVSSPPATAGPGLKGFISRLRNKPRTIDPSLQYVGQHSPQLSVSSSLRRTDSSTPRNLHDTSPTTPRPHQQSPPTLPQGNPESVDPDETVALRQLFDAAHNLGLDEKKLNDLLLVRSGSTSSRTSDWPSTLTRSNSSAAAFVTPDSRPARAGDNERPVSTGGNRRTVDDRGPSRAPSLRKQSDHLRRPREGQNERDPAVSAVIRRTIIVPSDTRTSTVDINALLRKNSSRRRRVSAASISGRSIHDRVPTPPPRTAGRRYSKDTSPPVPQLPQSVSLSGENHLNVPGIEKSNSTYDSLYDMYAGDNKPNAQSSVPNERAGPSEATGPSIEVIELANGETIWSIVNGLRDDDSESLYASRTSLASEYDVHDEDMQVYVREHLRKSVASNYSPQKPQGKSPRPETKVFYSSSAQIGRLIENISQGMEAGSFNFRTVNPPVHSPSSSLSTFDNGWTVEERLDHMIGSMKGA